MTSHDQAVSLLRFYMSKAWKAAGLEWQDDNDGEIAAIVDHVVAAVTPKLTALDSECGECSGIGFMVAKGRSCEPCGGKGRVITDAGRDLIAFLQRHPAALTRVEQED